MNWLSGPSHFLPAVDVPAEIPPGLVDESTGTIAILLQGGPADMPDELRICRGSCEVEQVKVPYYGGYEHFERLSTAADGDGPVVLHWTGRTRVAE